MPPTKRIDRYRLPLYLAVMVAAATHSNGCSVDATGIKVTLQTGGLDIDRLAVTIVRDSTTIGTGQYPETGAFPSPIADGASFGIRLSDSLDGATVTVMVAAYQGASNVGTQSGSVAVEKHKAVPLTITFTNGIDGGLDMTSDFAVKPSTDGMQPDLSRAPDMTTNPDLHGDLAMSGEEDMTQPADLSSFDLLPPDMTFVCSPSCNGGVSTICTNNVPSQFNCGFGCDGPRCAGPSTCNAPGDISTPGTYGALVSGANGPYTGSCQVVPGPENVLTFKTNVWANWKLTVNSSFPAAFFSRTACADTTTELAINALCDNSVIGAACFGGNNTATQTLCGLPPNMPYYAFVEHAGGTGGTYQITSAVPVPVNLNDCPNAGMLPPPSFTTTGTTVGQKNNMHAPMGGNNCNGTDLGANSPESVYWVPLVSAGKTLRVVVQGQNGFQPLIYAEPYCDGVANNDVCSPALNGTATINLSQLPANSAYYIIVDGQGGASGAFTITETVQ